MCRSVVHMCCVLRAACGLSRSTSGRLIDPPVDTRVDRSKLKQARAHLNQTHLESALLYYFDITRQLAGVGEHTPHATPRTLAVCCSSSSRVLSRRRSRGETEKLTPGLPPRDASARHFQLIKGGARDSMLVSRSSGGSTRTQRSSRPQSWDWRDRGPDGPTCCFGRAPRCARRVCCGPEKQHTE